MKTKIILIFLIAVSFGLNSFKKKKNSFSPPGTVKISEKLFYDETEITNFHWGEYLSYYKYRSGDTSDEYKASLPDTTVWFDPSSYNPPYVNYYLRHAAYKDYPVVGISYEQASEYCKWRTDRVKEYFQIRNKASDNVPKNFQYRLPSKSEFETIAKAQYSEKTLNSFEKKYKGMPRWNFKRETTNTTDSVQNKNPDVTAPVYSYWENSYGVYQIFGNVAEMISEKGIAKGGSWKDKESEVSVEKDFIYDVPKSWLGFRCLCEIIEE